MQETQNRILEHDLTDLPTRIRVLGVDGFYRNRITPLIFHVPLRGVDKASSLLQRFNQMLQFKEG